MSAKDAGACHSAIFLLKVFLGSEGRHTSLKNTNRHATPMSWDSTQVEAGFDSRRNG